MTKQHLILTKLAAVVALSFASHAHAQTVEIDNETVQAGDSDMTLQELQDAMDPIRLIESYVVDKQGPRNERGGWGNRSSNVYDVGEQIDAVIYLANVGKHNPGLVDNPQEMELYINIRDKSGGLINQIRPVHTYQGVRRIDAPLQDDYFSDRFTVSARILAPGRYDVGFVFIDHTRPPDKQVPLEVMIDVVVTDTQPDAALTDFVDMMAAGEVDVTYSVARCAAYFHGMIELVGRESFTSEDFAIMDQKVQYFLGAGAVIRAGNDGVDLDTARDQAFAAMKEISDMYKVRMFRNYNAGQHPWNSDRMLQRDEQGCNVIYENRTVE